MAQDCFQKIGYIGLNKPDGSLMLNVPLYVKIGELGKSDMAEMQEKTVSRITEIMLKRYEKQLSDYFTRLKQITEKERQ